MDLEFVEDRVSLDETHLIVSMLFSKPVETVSKFIRQAKLPLILTGLGLSSLPPSPHLSC